MMLTQEQRVALAEIASRHGLRLVVAFGSRVTGRSHSASDLDIGVLSANGDARPLDVVDLTVDLSRIFPGEEADVAVLDHADPLFLKEVFETAMRLFGDQREFQRFRLRAFRQFGDYAPYLQIEARATRALIERLRRAG